MKGFRNNKSRTEDAKEFGFEQLKEMKPVQGRDKKDLPAFTPSGVRQKSEVVESDVIVFDVDEGITIEQFETNAEGYEYLLYTTSSHTEEHHKFRVVMPLEAPVEGVEGYEKVWRAAHKEIFGDDATDESASSPVQLQYLPAGDSTVIHREGKRRSAVVPASKSASGLEEYLNKHDVDDYFVWVNKTIQVIGTVQAGIIDEATGKKLWDDWSKTGSSYDEFGNNRKWFYEMKKDHSAKAFMGITPSDDFTVIPEKKVNIEQVGRLGMSISNVMDQDFPSPDWIIDNLLKEGEGLLIYSQAKVGKSWITTLLSTITATGADAGIWSAKEKLPTLFIDGEMMISTLKDRLVQVSEGLDVDIRDADLTVYNTQHEQTSMDICSASTQEMILSQIKQYGYKIVVLDNLTALTSASRSENDAEYGKEINAFINKIRGLGCSPIVVHHAGWNSSTPRGSSTLIAGVSVVMSIEKVEGFTLEAPAWGFKITHDRYDAVQNGIISMDPVSGVTVSAKEFNMANGKLPREALDCISDFHDISTEEAKSFLKILGKTSKTAIERPTQTAKKMLKAGGYIK